MIAISEVAVAVISSLIVAALLSLVIYLFARLVRRTHRLVSTSGGSRWLTLIGALISLLGIIDLIWTQVSGFNRFEGIGSTAVLRWQLATEPIMVIALGILVAIAAEILRTLQVRQTQQSQ